jgi:hypothetical protein
MKGPYSGVVKKCKSLEGITTIFAELVQRFFLK